MRSVFIVVAGFVLLTIESPLMFHMGLNFYAPDFTLILVMYLASTRPLLVGATAAFILGFLKDGFAGGPAGLYTQIMILIFYVARLVMSRVSFRSPLLLMAFAFVTSLLASVLFFLLSLLFVRDFTDYLLVFKMFLPQAIITAPFAPVVFYLAEWIDVFRKRKAETMFFSQ